jgi:hypothetical protein
MIFISLFFVWFTHFFYILGYGCEQVQQKVQKLDELIRQRDEAEVEFNSLSSGR